MMDMYSVLLIVSALIIVFTIAVLPCFLGKRSSREIESLQGKTYLLLSVIQLAVLVTFVWQVSSFAFFLDCAGGYALFWLGQSAMAAFASPGL